MYILITLFLLLLAAVVLGALRIFRPAGSSAWLVAALGVLFAWISVFFWQAALPVKILIGQWLTLSQVTASLELIANQSAWVYALSLTALAGAVVLTSPVRHATTGPAEWIGTLTLLALAIVSILADNPLTLVLLWTAIDLVEILIILRSSNSAIVSERTVIAFSLRAAGTGFALWASVISTANGQTFLFEQTPLPAGIFLLLAAGLRLGVLPLHLPYRQEPVLRRGFGTSLRLTTAVTSLVLLARLPAAAVEAHYVPYLLGLVALAAVYSAWKWFSAPDELSGRPYWIIGMSSLAVSATLRGDSAGSVAWGAALVLFGGLSFLYSARQIWFTRILAGLGVLLLSLPFTLTASGWQGAFPLPVLFWPLFLIAQVLLVVGYLRHIFRPGSTSFSDLPSWTQTAYPLGLVLLALTALILGCWGWSGALSLGNWVVALVLVLLAALAALVVFRFRRLGNFEMPVSVEQSPSQFAVFQERLVNVFWDLYRNLGRLFTFAAQLLEGDGGLLWTLLLLVLFISLLQVR